MRIPVNPSISRYPVSVKDANHRRLLRARHKRPGSRRAERRRALELLDASCDGCTEAIMQARGVTIEMLVDLVRDGLATVHRRPARMRRACRWRLRV